MRIKKMIMKAAGAAIFAAVSFLVVLPLSAQEQAQVSHKKSSSIAAKRTEVGTGWSTKENPKDALEEAVRMALDGKKRTPPDFAIIFASSGSDMKTIFREAKKIFKNKTKLYGGTSDSRAVMTDKGYAKATSKAYEAAKMEGTRSLAIMTVTSKDITFGVGSAHISNYPTPQAASKAAVLSAIRSAGKSAAELPAIVLMTPTKLVEDELIEGIESVVGKKTPIMGGTAGGPDMAVIGSNDVYEQGISLAVIYTKLKVGYVFEAGFDVIELSSGVVTKTAGQEILEIDHKPAMDVYDKWLDGDLIKLIKGGATPAEVRGLLNLHPIYRKYAAPDGTVYSLFANPWPADYTLQKKSIMVSVKIKPGERIYLSRGTWEIFVNRIGNLPQKAMNIGRIAPGTTPILGIGYICTGVLSTIPESERPKLPIMMNYTHNAAPFIAPFTWGEEGHFAGVGNKHGNLLTGFLVISEK
jgi:hypothetical protein